MSVELERMYRHWIENLWCGEFDWAPRLVAEEFGGHWPGEVVRGREELLAKINEGHASFESLRFSIEVAPFCAQRHVAGRWRGVGHQNGSPVTFVGNDILRSDGERFAEYWVGSMMVP